MPTKSNRTKMLLYLRALLNRRLQRRVMRNRSGDRNIMQDVVDRLLFKKLKELESRRYLRRNKYRKRKYQKFLMDSDCGKGDRVPHLTEREFRRKYRMSRVNFAKLVGLLKNHPVFEAKNRTGIQMAPVSEQVMTFLHYIGGRMNTGSTTRDVFSIGYGTHFVYCDRVAEALSSLRKEVVYWPDIEERKLVASRMKAKFDFPSCVGMGDGTLFPLAFQPSTSDAPDYSGRKFKYSLTCFIVNDDQRRIRAYSAGWPGSVHDNRVFGNMRVSKKHTEYFDESQYILSDSALENSKYVVSAFKKPPAQEMPNDRERFNTKLAKARIYSEHTIGILKGRFQWLKEIGMLVTEEKKSMVRILKYIDCCIILHNLLVANVLTGEESQWINQDDASDLDDPMRAPTALDRLHTHIMHGSLKDERRSRLKHYFEGKEYA